MRKIAADNNYRMLKRASRPIPDPAAVKHLDDRLTQVVDEIQKSNKLKINWSVCDEKPDVITYMIRVYNPARENPGRGFCP